MNLSSKILIAISAAFLIIIILGGLYVYSLSRVEIKGVSVDELKDINEKGFRLDGNVQVYNGGILPVGIEGITYNIVLEGSGNELAAGNITGKRISPRQITGFPFSNQINWAPTSEVAWGLITPGQTYARINGTIYVADLKVVDFKVPFETRVDLEPYIKQFAKTRIQDILDKYVGNNTAISNETKEKIGAMAEKAIEGLSDILG